MARTAKTQLSKDQAPCKGVSSISLSAGVPASKIAQVINMLERSVGASLADFAEQIGWLLISLLAYEAALSTAHVPWGQVISHTI